MKNLSSGGFSVWWGERPREPKPFWELFFGIICYLSAAA
jgi:hypothetical protein